MTRTVSTSAAITVNLTWSGSATITSDYTLTAVGGTLGAGGTTLTLAAGVSSATITAKPVDDSIIETAETVTVTVVAGTGYTPGAPASATGSIADNDTPVVVVAATDASGAEQGQDPIVFTVTRTVNTTVSSAITLTWGGTATLTADYTLTVSAGATLSADGLTLTLNPGTTSATITAKPVDDSIVEAAETVILTLVGGTNYAVGAGASATGTIADNEFSISVGNASGTEQDHNKFTSIDVPVTLSSASTGTITVTATTVAGTALAGSDFVSKTQVLTFGPGTTTVNFTVSIVPDSIAEPTETFTVVLSAPTGATIANGTGTVTVFDNDGAQMAAETTPASAPAVETLSADALAQVVAQAEAVWHAVLPDASFSGVTFTIADLPNLFLAQTIGQTVTIDASAAGWGWSAMDPGAAAAEMDLLTVVLHELGRTLGFTEADASRLGIMQLTLAPGVQRTLSVSHVPAGAVFDAAAASRTPLSIHSNALGAVHAAPTALPRAVPQGRTKARSDLQQSRGHSSSRRHR